MLHFTLQHEDTHTKQENIAGTFLHFSTRGNKTKRSFLISLAAQSIYSVVSSSPKRMEHILSVTDDVYIDDRHTQRN